MPFGLSNAPAVFQDLINDVLREFLSKFVVVYLDDILIFSQSLKQHRVHVRQVLQKLSENLLYAKLEKCDFEVPEVSFLGYSISSKGLPWNLENYSPCWALPNNLKAIQCFLGFANYYRRFIPAFSVLVAPIVSLTKKGADPTKWSTQASSAPILKHPNPDLPFIVEVDASEVGVGAVLSRRDPESLKHSLIFLESYLRQR